jgi:formate dehydrogenase alpha subunit
VEEVLDCVRLTIGGREVETQAGKSILEAALEAGIYIPHLCWLPQLQPYAGCRLCLVQIKGWQKRLGLVTACTQPVAPEMEVLIDTPEVIETRREVLELILSDHPDRCLTCTREVRCPPFAACTRDPVVTDRCVICAKNERCELQEVVDHIGVKRQRFYGKRREYPIERTNPFIERDWNKCIHCGRCVRACVEIRGVGAIDFAYRGQEMMVTTPFEEEMKDTNCEFDGQCVLVCPTGALMERRHKYAGNPDHSVATICPYCGCGCNIRVHLKGGKIIRVTPEADNSVNEDCLCVKGHFGYDFVQSAARLKGPLVRRRGGALAKAKWDRALDLVAQRLTEIKEEYGPDAIGVIASAKCTNEENYLTQKLARAVVGTNNVDSCADLCHKPTLQGLTAAFGQPAMTNSIADIEKAGCIFVIGSNTTETHPIVALRIKWAVRKGAKLIVANPREIDLCRFAHVWLRHNPGTDVALINGMMRVILDADLWDGAFASQHCEGFYPLLLSLQKYDLDHVSEVTGVTAEDIVTAARLFAMGGRDPEYQMPPVYYGPLAEVGAQGETDSSCILYGTGITHHIGAVNSVRALANLAMLTGNLGVEGGGLNPLAGQNNVQGACDMGTLPTRLPGYQPMDDAKVREKFEQAWQVGLPAERGLSLMEMLWAAHEGKLKALYIIGENPMLSAPDLTFVRECLENLEFLVVQDIFFTETAQLADVVLAGASFAEKEGTFTNAERRVQLLRRVIPPVNDGKADWQIICELAKRMTTSASSDGWGYTHPAEVMTEINRLVPIYRGITYDRLEGGGLQWPCPGLDQPGTKILYETGFDRGKGQFIPVEYDEPSEPHDEEYPLTLVTGRILFHYHTGRMTMRSKGLVAIRPEGYAEIHSQDAENLGISDGDMVKVISRQGEVTTKVRVSNSSLPGTVFMTFHYAESPVNQLIGHDVDPETQVHNLKTCAVRLERC